MNKPPSVQDIIKSRVDMVKDQQFRLELVHPDTRQRMSPAQREALLHQAFFEVAKGMGIDRFVQTPAELLEQFAVMSINKNHDTAGMLRSLINAFMVAYATPETSSRAFAALTEIEALRVEVAQARAQGTNRQEPAIERVARVLQTRLNDLVAAPPHDSNEPAATVMAGKDRLFVKPMKGYILKGLPNAFMGIPVEAIQELAS